MVIEMVLMKVFEKKGIGYVPFWKLLYFGLVIRNGYAGAR